MYMYIHLNNDIVLIKPWEAGTFIFFHCVTFEHCCNQKLEYLMNTYPRQQSETQVSHIHEYIKSIHKY